MARRIQRKRERGQTATEYLLVVSVAMLSLIGAAYTLALAASATPEESAEFANHAAGVVVGKIGTAPVHPDELLRNFKEDV